MRNYLVLFLALLAVTGTPAHSRTLAEGDDSTTITSTKGAITLAISALESISADNSTLQSLIHPVLGILDLVANSTDFISPVSILVDLLDTATALIISISALPTATSVSDAALEELRSVIALLLEVLSDETTLEVVPMVVSLLRVVLGALKG